MRLEEIIKSTLGYEHYDMCIGEQEFLLEGLDTKLLDCGFYEDLDRPEDNTDKSVEDDEEIELDLDDFLDGIE